MALVCYSISVLYRMVCEAVLKSGKLNFRNESSWCQSFDLVFSLLSSIDYKVQYMYLCVIP